MSVQKRHDRAKHESMLRREWKKLLDQWPGSPTDDAFIEAFVVFSRPYYERESPQQPAQGELF